MDQIRSDKAEGAPACAQTADAGAPSDGAGPERRFSAQRKLAVVTRLLRGEPLETVARELNITVARLTEWRDLVARDDAGQVTVFGKGGKTRVVLLQPGIWRELTNL